MMKIFLKGIFLLAMLTSMPLFAANFFSNFNPWNWGTSETDNFVKLGDEARGFIKNILSQKEPQKMRGTDHRKGNMLSIDSGGIKIMISTQYLKYIEEWTSRPIYESFEYMGGTGLGAIIVICSAGYKMSMAQISQLFQETFKLHLKYFPNDEIESELVLSENQAKTFNVVMKELQKEVFNNDNLLLDKKFSNEVNLTLISSIDDGSAGFHPYLYRNYLTSKETKAMPRLSNVEKLSEVVTKILLPKTKFKDKFIDASVVANNPAEIIFMDVMRSVNPTMNLVVSAGSGAKPADCDSGIMNYGRIISMLQETESTHKRFEHNIPSHKSGAKYERINVSISPIKDKITHKNIDGIICFYQMQGETAIGKAVRSVIDRLKKK